MQGGLSPISMMHLLRLIPPPGASKGTSYPFFHTGLCLPRHPAQTLPDLVPPPSLCFGLRALPGPVPSHQDEPNGFLAADAFALCHLLQGDIRKGGVHGESEIHRYVLSGKQGGREQVSCCKTRFIAFFRLRLVCLCELNNVLNGNPRPAHAAHLGAPLILQVRDGLPSASSPVFRCFLTTKLLHGFCTL